MAISTSRTAAHLLLVLAAPLALAACGGNAPEEDTYEADVTDESGGELIVADPEAEGVEDVTLPETPMTPVPPEATASPAPSASPTPE